MSMEKISPLFKYIGGKSWLRDSLREKVKEIIEKNNNIKSYVEPFAGGLGSFLSVYDILLTNDVENIVLSDINENLIFTYNAVKDNPLHFIQEFLKIEQGFADTVDESWKYIKDKQMLKIMLKPCELYFNNVKKDFNTHKLSVNIIQSARLVFLQKHSFNGIYRENSKGFYNTPFNWSGSNMIDSISSKVQEMHQLFNKFNLNFIVQSFEDVNYNNSSLYYLDPPYLNETIGENKYNKDLFSLKEQMLLIEKIKDKNFIYSNHHSKLIVSQFNKLSNVSILEMARKNIMSSKSASRKQDKLEILVTRFSV